MHAAPHARSTRARIASMAVLAMLALLLPMATEAGAVDGVVASGVEVSLCRPMMPCDVPVVGSGLDAVTSVTTSPVRDLSVLSQTPTRLVLRFPYGISALVDLRLHSAGGTTVLPKAVLFDTEEGEFIPLLPERLLDTRSAQFGDQTPLAAGATTEIDVSDSPTPIMDAAGSLVLNVTVTRPQSAGYLTVYPSDVARPLASNLNFSPGQTRPNLVSVRLSADRKISIYNGSGSTAHVLVDAVGLHTRAGHGGGLRLMPMEPVRAYDSRGDAPFTDGGPETVSLGELPPGTIGVAMNVTAVNASRAGHVTVFPIDLDDPPLASNLNVADASPVPNMVVVGAYANGEISIDTSIPQVDLIFDVVGVYLAPSVVGVPPLPDFTGVTPERVLDTRNGTGSVAGPLVAGQELSLDVAGIATVPDGAEAVLLNVTVTGPTRPGYLTVWPGGGPRPVVSSLNYLAAQTVANLVLVPVGADGSVRFYLPSGSAHVVADLAGYYGLP